MGRGKAVMTDDEYREYLTALARKYLKVLPLHRDFHHMPGELAYEIERLSSNARFVKAVSERSENGALLKVVAEEVRNAYVDQVIHAMERSGVLAALDEAPEITFGNLRQSVIPPEDAELLRNAGVEHPEAEITLVIHYSRRCFLGRQETTPSETAHRAQGELKRAGERLGEFASEEKRSETSEKKKRKLFNGIGKILAGTIAGAGNLLLAAGTIVAPNPATAYGVIASSALAVGGICQGIGDLRGE
jgi:hypothetical protein